MFSLQLIPRLNRLTGVYSIINKVNGKIYVGWGIDIKESLSADFNKLKKGLFKDDFQKDFDRLGERAFIYKILVYGKDYKESELKEITNFFIRECGSFSYQQRYLNSLRGDNSLIPTSIEELMRRHIEDIEFFTEDENGDLRMISSGLYMDSSYLNYTVKRGNYVNLSSVGMASNKLYTRNFINDIGKYFRFGGGYDYITIPTGYVCEVIDVILYEETLIGVTEV